MLKLSSGQNVTKLDTLVGEPINVWVTSLVFLIRLSLFRFCVLGKKNLNVTGEIMMIFYAVSNDIYAIEPIKL